MLLVLDVGNTNTVMGIFDGEELIRHWRLTSRKQTADEVGFMSSVSWVVGVSKRANFGICECRPRNEMFRDDQIQGAVPWWQRKARP